jgi:hypothetical protein
LIKILVFVEDAKLIILLTSIDAYVLLPVIFKLVINVTIKYPLVLNISIMVNVKDAI